jgi:UDPglucose 6-dehydrogenase
MRIDIIGTGYVGLVTGACLARLGHHVTCVDMAADRVEAINSAVVPFYEPGLRELVSQGLTEGRLNATCDISQAVCQSEITILTVGTPLRDGAIDLSYVARAAQDVGRSLRGFRRYHLIVVKSTVVPGTTDTLVREIVERESGMKAGEFGLCMNPEFLREGSAVGDFMQPDRIVIGQWDELSGETLAELYRSFDCPKLFTNPRNAELIKYASNAFLGTLVSFSNEIATLCEASPGGDAHVVMDALHLDRRLSPVIGGVRITPEILGYLRAGCGFGGSCLPKDIRALSAHAQERGVLPRILEAVMAVNQDRSAHLVELAENALGSVHGATVAVLGLAFKPGTDDLRDSPALRIIRQLLAKGATVQVYDPKAMHAAMSLLGDEVAFCRSPKEAVFNADAAIVVTAWPEFCNLDWGTLSRGMGRPVIIDGRNALRAVKWPSGTTYLAVGQYSSLARGDMRESTIHQYSGPESPNGKQLGAK